MKISNLDLLCHIWTMGYYEILDIPFPYIDEFLNELNKYTINVDLYSVVHEIEVNMDNLGNLIEFKTPKLFSSKEKLKSDDLFKFEHDRKYVLVIKNKNCVHGVKNDDDYIIAPGKFMTKSIKITNKYIYLYLKKL